MRHIASLRKIVGRVVSTSMEKTSVVEVERVYIHPKYRRVMRHRRKYFAHDEHEICGVGDRVQIRYAGALSKKKRWSIIDIILRQPTIEGERFEMSRLRFPPASSAAPAPESTRA
jgi:small subunit ribosomal protein S17